jgi:predicted lipoprotein
MSTLPYQVPNDPKINSAKVVLAAIDAAMLRIAERITEAVRGTHVAPSRSRENVVTKLVVRSDSAQVKIEVTPVLRGCVLA